MTPTLFWKKTTKNWLSSEDIFHFFCDFTKSQHFGKTKGKSGVLFLSAYLPQRMKPDKKCRARLKKFNFASLDFVFSKGLNLDTETDHKKTYIHFSLTAQSVVERFWSEDDAFWTTHRDRDESYQASWSKAAKLLKEEIWKEEILPSIATQLLSFRRTIAHTSS